MAVGVAGAPGAGRRHRSAGADEDGAASAEVVVSLRRIPGLDGIAADDAGLHIGALATIGDSKGQRPCGAYPGAGPGLCDLQHDPGAGNGHVGGNLCNGSPASDTAPALLACEAQSESYAGRGRGVHELAEIVSPGRTALPDPGRADDRAGAAARLPFGRVARAAPF